MRTSIEILLELFAQAVPECNAEVLEYCKLSVHSLSCKAENLQGQKAQPPEEYRERVCMQMQIMEDLYFDMIVLSAQREIMILKGGAKRLNALADALVNPVGLAVSKEDAQLVQSLFTERFRLALRFLQELRAKLKYPLGGEVVSDSTPAQIEERVRARLAQKLRHAARGMA